MGSGCKYRWSFTTRPSAVWTGMGPWLRGWGPPGFRAKACITLALPFIQLPICLAQIFLSSLSGEMPGPSLGWGWWVDMSSLLWGAIGQGYHLGTAWGKGFIWWCPKWNQAGVKVGSHLILSPRRVSKTGTRWASVHPPVFPTRQSPFDVHGPWTLSQGLSWCPSNVCGVNAQMNRIEPLPEGRCGFIYTADLGGRGCDMAAQSDSWFIVTQNGCT